MTRKQDEKELSMEERLSMKQNGFCKPPSDSGAPTFASTKKRRANKNCPTEITSKRAVGRFREVIQMEKVERRDPRFDSLSGKLNDDLFKKAYSFLDDYCDEELAELKKQLKKTKNKSKREDLSRVISKMQQERIERRRADRIQEAHRKRKREERQAVASGKNPYYMKRSEKKKVELQAKYEELKEKGGVAKYMAKKRKQNASKDHRWLPTQRKQ